MTELLCALLGLAVGFAAGWVLAALRARGGAAALAGRAGAAESLSAELRRQWDDQRKEMDDLRSQLQGEMNDRIQAQTRLEELRRKFDEERKLLDDATARLTDAFKSLSADALRSNNASFLQLAQETMQVVQARTDGALETRQMAMEGIVAPLAESLKKFEIQIAGLENSRQEAYGGLAQHLRTMAETHQKLQAETANLAGALKAPQVRGRWGEITLRRVAELAGMAEHCDFEEQASQADEKGRLQRPDLIVHLPGGRDVVVDAKTVLAAYLEAVEATSEEERKSKLAQHAAQVRRRVRDLASKDYARNFATPPELTILFLPGESFFAAAASHDPALIEDSAQAGVILATPTTLMALLRAVAYGWRQAQAAENARRIAELGAELHERAAKLAEHLETLGRSLGKSVQAYNEAVGTIELRVLATARKFRELGVEAGAAVRELPLLEDQPRRLAAPELTEREPRSGSAAS